MADRSDDWNALFDPATEVLELRRIAAEHPEFAEQATQHLNWVPTEEAPPPPAATAAAAPVYLVPTPAVRSYALSPAGRVLWLTTGVVWIVVYGVVGVLPIFGISLVDTLFAGAEEIASGVSAAYAATLGLEAIAFILAFVAAIVAGQTIGRRIGGAATVVIGFLALGLLLLFIPQLVIGAITLAFSGFEGAGFLLALYTALPVALEVLIGVIAYAISGDRKWHVLWTVPIALALVFGAYLLGEPLASALGEVAALVVLIVIGVVIRLIVVLLAAAFGRRVESEILYDAPAFAPPRY